MLQQPDSLFALEYVIASSADVEQRTRFDPKELVRLLLVGVETDVFFDGKLLLAHVGDRPARRRLTDGERGDAIEVRDRPDHLVNEESVVAETVGGHGCDRNHDR